MTVAKILKKPTARQKAMVEDHLGEVIVSTGEKFAAGKLDLKNAREVTNYLMDATWYSFKNAAKIEKNRADSFDPYSYQEICHPEESNELTVDSTEAVAKRIDDYLLANYPFVEFGLFKTYAMGEHSYESLAELTGFSDTKCWLIVKKIREDLLRNADKFLGTKQNED